MKEKTATILISAVLAALAATAAPAQTADEILEEAERRHEVDSSRTSMAMLVYPDYRDERDVRRFEMTGYERGSDESVMTFTEPRSLNGLSLLSLEDDQWIYFPSTGRVRKVAGRSKDDSVQGVGGDFSYEDLSAGDWREKYAFTIADEDRRSWVLDGRPVRDSTYSRIEVTIDRRRWMITGVLYWKEGTDPVKELLMEEVEEIDGREVPVRTVMKNLEEGSMTVIETLDAEWNVDIGDARFNPNRFWK